jgi:hypothetical protein
MSTNWVVLFQPSGELIELKSDQASQREAFGRLLVAPGGIQFAAVPRADVVVGGDSSERMLLATLAPLQCLRLDILLGDVPLGKLAGLV